MISIQTEGRRHYLIGDTYAVRDRIRSAGGHWDAERKAWWTAKRQVAEQFASSTQSGERTSEPLDPKQEIIGRAKYKDREYLLLWEGETKRGTRAAKLAFRDGSKTFWADESEYRITKRYREPLTLKKLNQLADEYKEQQAADKAADAEAGKHAAMTPEQRLAQMDEVLVRVGRVRATRDDGAGLVTETLGFDRADKASVDLGEIIQHRRKGHSSPDTYVVVIVGAPYYHSRDMCEDMDCFCHEYGWKTPYEAIRVQPTDPEIAARERNAAEDAERNELQSLLDRSHGAETHIGSSAPHQDITLTELWSNCRLSGSENWYLGSDGIVYYMRSDYDMGPSWWRTTATPQQIERAKELGLKP